MAREVELGLWPSDAKALPPHVLRAVERLFEAQVKKSIAERQRLKAKSLTRWNKQDVHRMGYTVHLTIYFTIDHIILYDVNINLLKVHIYI